ncbi:MAG: sensor domain-containing diguanylate cyclase [Acetobacterales bacterium]
MKLATQRSRLIAVVVLLLAASFAAVNYIQYTVSHAALKQAMVERELPLTGDTIYSEIQTDLVRPIFVSSQMAHDTFLRDWALQGESPPDAVRRFLDEIRDAYGFFTAFLVSEQTRRYYHFSGVSKTVSPDDPRDAWYFRVRDMAAEYEINVDPNQQQDDRVTIFFNYKVRDYDGRLIGVTGVGMALDTVAGIIDRYRGDFDRTVFFVDRAGRVTLHPDRQIAYQRTLAELPGISQVAGRIVQAGRGAFEYSGDSGTVLVTTRYIPELDWILIVEQDESAATAAAHEGLVTTVVIGLLAILLSGLAIGWTINLFQRRLEDMATTDPLTGLHNRQLFDISLNQAVERARRTNAPLSLMLIDLDHFKAVNDRFGHLKGDLVLRHVAGLLRGSVRKADVLARWGGEEFAVLMENCNEANARRAAEVLRRKIDDDRGITSDSGLHTTGSFGVATLAPGEDVRALMARADKALYRAKDLGRNRVAGSADLVEAPVAAA